MREGREERDEKRGTRRERREERDEQRETRRERREEGDEGGREDRIEQLYELDNGRYDLHTDTWE
jgi:hypothetical protein